MACKLATEFLCTSVNNIRVAEDSIAALLLIFIMWTLLSTIFTIVKEGPLVKRLWVMVLALVPFLVWKLLGAFRRVFLDKSNPLYDPLHDFGEVMESVSALFILVSLIYMYLLIKPKKMAG